MLWTSAEQVCGIGYSNRSQTLSKNPGGMVKIFLSSRDDMDIVHKFSPSPNIFITVEDNREDIERFIETEIQQAIDSQRLLYGNVSSKLKMDITNSLVSRAQGMWVSSILTLK